jgi:integral membrane protein (TIGR01906 family)
MKLLKVVLAKIVTLLIPVILVLLVVRLLLTPLYIQIEYRLPGFPVDPYGFTINERLYWANISRLYLVTDKGIDYLEDQKLDENKPLYNERELQHMYDVKVVIQSAMIVLYGSILLVVALGYWAKSSTWWQDYIMAISQGGWLTIGIIVAVLLYLVLNFNSLFTNFHRIFFEGDTWLFRFSDTLIRLFPVQFWRDAFIWIGVLSILAGLSLGYFLPKKRK